MGGRGKLGAEIRSLTNSFIGMREFRGLRARISSVGRFPGGEVSEITWHFYSEPWK